VKCENVIKYEGKICFNFITTTVDKVTNYLHGAQAFLRS